MSTDRLEQSGLNRAWITASAALPPEWRIDGLVRHAQRPEQGPSHRWHLWILDVDGVRVVVHSMDYAGTSAQHRAELEAIVDSVQIEP